MKKTPNLALKSRQFSKRHKNNDEPYSLQSMTQLIECFMFVLRL
jgi:hypothetical protein